MGDHPGGLSGGSEVRGQVSNTEGEWAIGGDREVFTGLEGGESRRGEACKTLTVSGEGARSRKS